jgi:hypothetical protein
VLSYEGAQWCPIGLTQELFWPDTQTAVPQKLEQHSLRDTRNAAPRSITQPWCNWLKRPSFSFLSLHLSPQFEHK